LKGNVVVVLVEAAQKISRFSWFPKMETTLTSPQKNFRVLITLQKRCNKFFQVQGGGLEKVLHPKAQIHPENGGINLKGTK
jgi:hypothetical protein